MERKDIKAALKKKGISFNPAAKTPVLEALLKGNAAPKAKDGLVSVTFIRPAKAAGVFRSKGDVAALSPELAEECVVARLAAYAEGTPEAVKASEPEVKVPEGDSQPEGGEGGVNS